MNEDDEDARVEKSGGSQNFACLSVSIQKSLVRVGRSLQSRDIITS